MWDPAQPLPWEWVFYLCTNPFKGFYITPKNLLLVNVKYFLGCALMMPRQKVEKKKVVVMKSSYVKQIVRMLDVPPC